MERVGDPSFVSAVLSAVVSLRNKLQSLGFSQVWDRNTLREIYIQRNE